MRIEPGRNNICFTMRQTSLAVEKYLLDVPELLEDWIALRKKIAYYEEKKLFAEVAKMGAIQPIKMTVEFDISSSTTFGMILYK